MVPKFKMIRIYWNLVHVMFRKSLSWFWCQRLFLLNIYHLLGPNWSQNWKCSEFIEIWHIWYFEYPNLGFDVKVIFIKYLSPVWHKLVPKLEVLRIYWNLAQSIFQICQSWFCCQKYFSLLNIYQLLGPNWSQNEKCSEFIEIWLNWYFQYANLNFDVQMIFIKYLPSARPKLVQN